MVGLRYAVSDDAHADTVAVLRLALDDPASPLAGREFEVCVRWSLVFPSPLREEIRPFLASR